MENLGFILPALVDHWWVLSRGITRSTLQFKKMTVNSAENGCRGAKLTHLEAIIEIQEGVLELERLVIS